MGAGDPGLAEFRTGWTCGEAAHTSCYPLVLAGGADLPDHPPPRPALPAERAEAGLAGWVAEGTERSVRSFEVCTSNGCR